MIEVQPGQSLSAGDRASRSVRLLTEDEIDGVSGAETISCIWVCRQVPGPSDPPATSAGFDGDDTHYDCQLVCGPVHDPGDDYPPV